MFYAPAWAKNKPKVGYFFAKITRTFLACLEYNSKSVV